MAKKTSRLQNLISLLATHGITPSEVMCGNEMEDDCVVFPNGDHIQIAPYMKKPYILYKQSLNKLKQKVYTEVAECKTQKEIVSYLIN